MQTIFSITKLFNKACEFLDSITSNKKEEINKTIKEESSKRLESWFNQNKSSLQEKIKDFHNPEKAFECLILKKLMMILEQMKNEYIGESNEHSFNSYRELIEAHKPDFSTKRKDDMTTNNK